MGRNEIKNADKNKLKEIQLTQRKVALVDDDDFEWLSKYRWHAYKKARRTGDIWYARRCGPWNREKRGPDFSVLMHREIAIKAELPKSNKYDHRDGNGLNNQRCNLRPCSDSQNLANRKKSPGTSSKFKGVSFSKTRNKWRARITVNYKGLYIGAFDTQEEAADAYLEAAKKYFGEFARAATNDNYLVNAKTARSGF